MHLKGPSALLLLLAEFAVGSLEASCPSPASTILAAPTYITVTAREILERTVTVTASAITSIPVIQIPAAVPDPAGTPSNDVVSAPIYDSTIWQTAYATVPVNNKPHQSSEKGPLSFMVVDGTTSWLGESPAPGEVLIYASIASTVTLIPEREGEPTTTVQSTTTSTSTLLFEHVIPVVHTSTSINSPSTDIIATTETEVDLIFSDSSDYSSLATIIDVFSTNTVGAQETSVEMFCTSTTDASGSTATESGLLIYSTLTAPALTVSPGGPTTAVFNSETLSWTATTTSPVFHVSPSPPYANSTLSTFSTITTRAITIDTISYSLVEVSPSTESLATSTGNPGGSTVSTSSSASSLPSSCGATGDFVLNFDDIPPLVIGNQNFSDVAPMPVFNPYRKFKFSNGFAVVPPPRVPYLPSSKPLLLEFIPRFTLDQNDRGIAPNSPDFGWSGDIGNADQGRSGCFSYNLYGASLGCDSQADDCIFSFTGFQADQGSGSSKQIVHELVTVPACPQVVDCALATVTLNKEFKNMDVVRINVTVGGVPRLWWIDDVRLGWFDNNCATGLCRQNTRVR